MVDDGADAQKDRRWLDNTCCAYELIKDQGSLGPTMDSPLLLAFPLLLVLSTPCEACGCKIQHPQTFYCMSEVVIIADILGYGNDTKLKRGLKINIIEVQPCLLCWRACPQAELTECVWKQRDCDYQIWGGNESLYSMCVPSLAGRCEWTNIQVYQAQTQPPTSPETTPLILDIAG
ncbi:hypothetical protein Cadr_000011112 [Camelus dromedarius]|uniref:Uncharacterized protein n=1 Tax=Camelus dromedarius TaxID=9838 RepID=A0A5N4DVE5_CAMDR|nr:hypothetical protein Cadr_000011112 [Camelus dromedarius]